MRFWGRGTIVVLISNCYIAMSPCISSAVRAVLNIAKVRGATPLFTDDVYPPIYMPTLLPTVGKALGLPGKLQPLGSFLNDVVEVLFMPILTMGFKR